MYFAGWIVLLVLSISVSVYALVVYGFLPFGSLVYPDIRASFELHPGVVYLHVFGAMVALALGPFQFSPRLRISRPHLHRWCGRAYLGAGVLIGGLAGFYMAFFAFGGLASRLGFACLAVAWLYTGFRAYQAIRARDVAAHRRWMLRNFALTFGAVMLRLWVPASVMSGIPFEQAYPVIAWLCWVPNLLLAELIIRQKSVSLKTTG